MTIGDIRQAETAIHNFLLNESDNEKCYTKKAFKKFLVIEDHTLEKAIRILKAKKIIQSVPAFTEESRLAGKGFVLTESLK